MLKFILAAVFGSTLIAGEIKLVNDSPEPIRGFWLQTPSNIGPNYVSIPPSPIVYQSQNIGNQFYAGPTATTYFAAKFSPNRTGELTSVSPYVNKLSGTGEFVVEIRSVVGSKPGVVLSSGTNFAPTYMAYKSVPMSNVTLNYGVEYYCVVYATTGNSIRWGYTGSNGNWSWSTNSGSLWSIKQDRNFQFKVSETVPTALLYPGETLSISCPSGFYQVYVAGNGTATYQASYAQWGSDLGVADYGFEIDRNYTYVFHYKDQNDSWYEKVLEKTYNSNGCTSSDEVNYIPFVLVILTMLVGFARTKRA